MIRSEMDQIKGIGEKSKDELLREFGSLGGIKNAPLEKLAEIIGRRRAEILWAHLRGDSQV